MTLVDSFWCTNRYLVFNLWLFNFILNTPQKLSDYHHRQKYTIQIIKLKENNIYDIDLKSKFKSKWQSNFKTIVDDNESFICMKIVIYRILIYNMF